MTKPREVDPEKAGAAPDPAAPPDKDGAEPFLPQKLQAGGGARGGYSLGLLPWFDSLSQNFGGRLIVMLFVVEHLQKGFMGCLKGMAAPYLYRSYGVPAPQVTIFKGVTDVPWSLKPMIGVISDTLPIRGFNKQPYMLFVSILGAAACLYVGLGSQESITAETLVMSFFVLNLQLSTNDLLCQARYSERMQACPEHGPCLLTFIWFGNVAAGLFAIVTSGPVLHNLGPKVPYIMMSVPSLVIILPMLRNFMGERRVDGEEVRRIRRRYMEQPEVCVLVVMSTLSSLVLMVCGIVAHSPLVNAIVAASAGAVMCVLYGTLLTPTIAKFAVFSIIWNAFTLDVGGASFYFYTDTAAMYPDGPHFSEYFYNTAMGVAESLCSLFGIYLYQVFMRTWKYRTLLVGVYSIYASLGILDVIMFARLNVRMGIPDHVFVFGMDIFRETVAQWTWMPQVVILSYLCPKGMEATMYAMIAGAHNIGSVISASNSALMLHRLGVQPRGDHGESAQFENLWIASAIASAAPLVACVLLYRLIPEGAQQEQLVGCNECTTGSLWRRWTGRDKPGSDAST